MKPKSLVMINDGANLEDVARTIIENYSIYHETASQLIELQKWTKQIGEVSTNVNGRTENYKKEVR